MADEARAMLDALMGGDRNAPLPQGASIERGGSFVPTKRKKSCYDQNVDPLYCAWGVDVYELFVNTKSDIGSNPKLVSEEAREEFVNLPQHEQERLGFHGMLFQKLQELVRMCDRTVSRNKEKLNQERRKGGVDYVMDVNERAIEQLCITEIEMEKLLAEILEKNKELESIMQHEKEEQEQRKKRKIEEKQEEKETSNEEKESKDDDKVADTVTIDSDQKVDDQATDTKGAESEPPKADDEDNTTTMELLLKRQRLLWELARLMQQYAPLQQAIEHQRTDLEFVKSDITSDKTVCEVSGNFMSARDADERIAAHYAGKQYVGWKLVRDKLKAMIQQYGRYGPPAGDRGPPRSGDGDRYSGGGDRYGGGDRSYSGGGGGRYGDRGGDRFRDRGDGNRGYDGRGGGGYGGGSGGDWRRGGGHPGGGHWRR
jgi:hypothetical protein